ncbi:MAG TPA: hypothetical protein DD381_12365 [Lentisphaeria bacterium]|nr:MAG: hypothetical protein A2X47_09375 [Lentisphaerae bacterium GWF2_38_69]HBM17120.1 hypothetical protein [Lentisphaeria bacterium]
MTFNEMLTVTFLSLLLMINPIGVAPFFPLTLPLTAGAGAIAITIALALRIPDGISHNSIVMYAGGVTGIFLMSLFVAVCYRFGGYIMDKIGTTGSNVVTRLSAFIIMAIGIAVIWDGVKPLILSLK